MYFKYFFKYLVFEKHFKEIKKYSIKIYLKYLFESTLHFVFDIILSILSYSAHYKCLYFPLLYILLFKINRKV